MSTSAPPFVTLNCPESEVSNLQECGPMRTNECPEILATHLQVECLKGTFYSLIILFYVTPHWVMKAALMKRQDW